jgi:hypothetical protein
MPKIKRIAISAKEADATAKFFVDALGIKIVEKFDRHGAKGCYLSDGDFNIAILDFKNETEATYVEVKYTGPDGIMIDVPETGWVGTSKS